MHPVELLKMGKSAFNSSRKKLGLPLESAIILPGILGLGWEEEDKATALPAAGFLTPHFPVSARDKTLVHRLHPLCCSWNRQLCSLPRMRNSWVCGTNDLPSWRHERAFCPSCGVNGNGGILLDTVIGKFSV